MTVPLGSIVYLASYMIRTRVTAETTMPDTPNVYGAELEVLDDHGGMDLQSLAGKRGQDGQIGFALRRQPEDYERYEDLPPDLTASTEDIGKYWVISTRNLDGDVVEQWAYIWYGAQYNKVYMGAEGPPGRIPDVQPSVKLIDPELESYIETTGGSTSPSWRFGIAAPVGPPGPVSTFEAFPDFTGTATKVEVDGTEVPFAIPGRVGTGGYVPRRGLVVTHNGEWNRRDQAMWSPANIMALNPQMYSVPQSAFTGYQGVSQRAAVGSFELPPQPFDWTPVVWGHIGMGGATLSSNPLLIGCEVLLGDPATGTRLARGMGTGLGEVNIMPHYSTPDNKNTAISPTNRHAVIPARHTNAAQGTVYLSLYNDGQLGYYRFSPANAQLFVLVVPIDAYDSYMANATRKVRR